MDGTRIIRDIGIENIDMILPIPITYRKINIVENR